MKISNNENIIKIYEKRMKQLIGPYHILANLVNSKYIGKKLNEDEIDEVMNLLGSNYPNFIPNILHFKTISGSIKTYIFKPELLNSVSPLCWWTSQSLFLHKETIDLIIQLLTAVASSTGVGWSNLIFEIY